MNRLNVLADWCAMPETPSEAIVRWAVLIPMIFMVVVLDRYFGSAAPAAAFGYALGSLTMYGTMRKRIVAHT